ncbi:hypothetical protein GCM10020369_83790 [Cryptosporangium minutisporangium]|uniref:SseB protein N-terminal domain-containing protein n=2 Tax=Cryptosporangium minutisporangium TaxID=113569 RepID=A0ABP6TE91_9ACTN
MYHALLRSDPARYFQTVTTAPLYLAAVSQPARRLVTWERDGRTYLLAFTSPEGLAHCLGQEADTVLQMDYPQLVRDWPDPNWWLALNPTTPIDATLPVVAVAEAASGAVEIPMPTVRARPDVPDLRTEIGDAPDVPANELEEAMTEVLAQGNVPLLLDLLVFAEVLLPTLRPVETVDLDDPYFPWAALPLSADRPVGEPAVGVFTSPQRLADAAPGIDVPSVRVSLLALALAWPGPEYALLVNPASSTRARLPGDQVEALPEWARLAAHYHGVEPDQTVHEA